MNIFENQKNVDTYADEKNGQKKGEECGHTCAAYYRLVPYVQRYKWGKKGKSSLVAQLAYENYMNSNNIVRHENLQLRPPFLSKIKEEENYAELWMGDHSNGRNFVILKKNGGEYFCEKLEDFLNENKHIFNIRGCNSSKNDKKEENNDKDNKQLSLSTVQFLLKTLSVQTPLSIQTHPDKQNAEKLHKIFPYIFYDSNHKPEMAVCLSEYFYLLCAFRDFSDICTFILNIDELQSLLGDSFMNKYHNFLHNYGTKVRCDNKDEEEEKKSKEEKENKEEEEFYKDLMKCVLSQEEEKIKALSLKLTNRVQEKKKSKNNLEDILSEYNNDIEQLENANNKKSIQSKIEEVEDLANYVHSYFPADVGIFFCFFLNFVRLKKNEAVFIGPNILHSYLYGECIECMAASDNVLRCGLTEKEKHKELLLQNILYKQEKIEKIQPKIFYDRKNKKTNSFVFKFLPNRFVEEFQILHLNLPPKQNTTVCFSEEHLCILIVIQANECTYIEDKEEEREEKEKKEKINMGDVFLFKPNANICFYNQLNSLNQNEKESEHNLLIYAATCADAPEENS